MTLFRGRLERGTSSAQRSGICFSPTSRPGNTIALYATYREYYIYIYCISIYTVYVMYILTESILKNDRQKVNLLEAKLPMRYHIENKRRRQNSVRRKNRSLSAFTFFLLPSENGSGCSVHYTTNYFRLFSVLFLFIFLQYLSIVLCLCKQHRNEQVKDGEERDLREFIICATTAHPKSQNPSSPTSRPTHLIMHNRVGYNPTTKCNRSGAAFSSFPISYSHSPFLDRNI